MTLPDEVLEAMARDLYGADAGLALADCRLAVEDLWNVITEKGYAVVPIEPTDRMYDAGEAARKEAARMSAVGGQTMESSMSYVRRYEHAIWRAMIRAAQEPGE